MHSDSDTDEEDARSDSESDDGDEAINPQDAVNDALMVMLTDGLLKNKLKDDDDGDFMKLTYNRLAMRNHQIMKELKKLGRRKTPDALTRATMMSEEYKRNRKELELMERGIEEAKTDPRRALKKVATTPPCTFGPSR